MTAATRYGAVAMADGATLVPRLSAAGAADRDMPPGVLWTVGDPALARAACVAVIGTRSPTTEGLAAARAWAAALARAGRVVASGHAPGIDCAAHAAALAAGGATVVWAPVGLGPAFRFRFMAELAQLARTDAAGANALVFEALAGGRLAVLSPFAPETKVEPWHFLRRNSLVAAACGAALVAETGVRGGTLDTARKAALLRRGIAVTALHPGHARHTPHAMLAAGGATMLPPEPDPEGVALAELLALADRADRLADETEAEARADSTFRPDRHRPAALDLFTPAPHSA